MTAATHSLEEEVARLEEALQPELARELKAGLEGRRAAAAAARAHPQGGQLAAAHRLQGLL